MAGYQMPGCRMADFHMAGFQSSAVVHNHCLLAEHCNRCLGSAGSRYLLAEHSVAGSHCSEPAQRSVAGSHYSAAEHCNSAEAAAQSCSELAVSSAVVQSCCSELAGLLAVR